MHPFYNPKCTIQNRNMHISVLNSALWDMGQVRCSICEIGQFNAPKQHHVPSATNIIISSYSRKGDVWSVLYMLRVIVLEID